MSDAARQSFTGVFLENILYGCYLSVFFESCIILARKQRTRNVKQMYVLATAIALFIFITMRCILDIAPCIIAIQGETLVFGPPNSKMGIITNICWCVATLIADSFIIFRTFIVWKKNIWVTTLPSLLFLANFGVSVWSMYSLVTFDPNTDVFSEIATTVDVFIYLTLFTNVLCTGLISYKIWALRRNVAGVLSTGTVRSDGVTSRIITIIVESAAVYTLLLIAQLISNSLKSYVTYILIDLTPPIIGLVFSYIIIRVSRGSSYGDSSARVDTSLSRDRANNYELSGTRNGRPGTRSQVQVRLETVTVQRSDRELGSESKDEDMASNKYPNASVV